MNILVKTVKITVFRVRIIFCGSIFKRTSFRIILRLQRFIVAYRYKFNFHQYPTLPTSHLKQCSTHKYYLTFILLLFLLKFLNLFHIIILVMCSYTRHLFSKNKYTVINHNVLILWFVQEFNIYCYWNILKISTNTY